MRAPRWADHGQPTNVGIAYRVVRVSDSRTDQCGKPLRGVVDGDGAMCVAHHVALLRSDASKEGAGESFLQLTHMRESLHRLIEE